MATIVDSMSARNFLDRLGVVEKGHPPRATFDLGAADVGNMPTDIYDPEPDVLRTALHGVNPPDRARSRDFPPPIQD